MAHAKSTSSGAGISERDRFWLEHHEAQVASGQSGKEYAAAKSLSLHAFYQARKRLRAIGAFPPAARKTKRDVAPERANVRFAKVAVVSPPAEPRRLRVVLPNGFALEWTGAIEVESVAHLVDRIAPLP